MIDSIRDEQRSKQDDSAKVLGYPDDVPCSKEVIHEIMIAIRQRNISLGHRVRIVSYLSFGPCNRTAIVVISLT